jgi:hypothetical protein
VVKNVVLVFLFLCSVWKFHITPINLRFICAPNPSSLTDVSKWLSVFYKSILPVVNDVWASMILVVKSVVLVFRFFMVFGSSIKPWLLWDLFVQSILLLSQMSLNHSVVSTKLYYLWANDLWASKLEKVLVPPVSSWILNDSTRAVGMTKLLNLLRSEVDKSSLLLLPSFDFSTLCTKINLVDLKACMFWLIECLLWSLNFFVFSFCWFEEITLNFRNLWLEINKR